MNKKLASLRAKRLIKKQKEKQKRLDALLLAYYEYYNSTQSPSMEGFYRYANTTQGFCKKHFGDIDAKARSVFKFQDCEPQQTVSKFTGRLFISSVVTTCKAFTPGIASIKQYIKTHGGSLHLLLCSDPAHSRDTVTVDKEFKDHNFILEDTKINNNFTISTVKVSSKQIQPLTGIAQLAHIEGSFCCASPKQNLETLPSDPEIIPRMAMTTGALTLPNYDSKKYMSLRTAKIAEKRHKAGAIILEIEDENIFHFRQIQFDSDGAFCDLGYKYSPNKIEKFTPVIIPGDWHTGETDPVVKSVTNSIIKKLGIKHIIFNDIFAGLSINPHEREKRLLRAAKRKISVEQELTMVAKELNEYGDMVEKVDVNLSNHDWWFYNYIENMDYREEKENIEICLKVSLAVLNGEYALEAGCKLCGLTAKNVKFIKPGENYRLYGVKITHGHKGINKPFGGTVASNEKAYGNCFMGHLHAAAIINDTYCVGTSTLSGREHEDGPQKRTQTLGLLYPNGHKQLINIINGRYTI